MITYRFLILSRLLLQSLTVCCFGLVSVFCSYLGLTKLSSDSPSQPHTHKQTSNKKLKNGINVNNLINQSMYSQFPWSSGYNDIFQISTEKVERVACTLWPVNLFRVFLSSTMQIPEVLKYRLWLIQFQHKRAEGRHPWKKILVWLQK